MIKGKATLVVVVVVVVEEGGGGCIEEMPQGLTGQQWGGSSNGSRETAGSEEEGAREG